MARSRYWALVLVLFVCDIGPACKISHTPFTRRQRQKKFEIRKRQERVIVEAPEIAEEPIEVAETEVPPEEIEREDEEEVVAPPKRRATVKGTPPGDTRRLDELALDLEAEPYPLELPCMDPDCARKSLDRVFTRLDEIDEQNMGKVRVLHLGDSHVAADYITGTIRRYLQYRFGEAGRGFTAIDQRAEYGGRRLQRKGWKRERIVDSGRSHLPFGFAGMSIESQRAEARVDFELEKQDRNVTVFYHAHRGGASIRLLVGDQQIGELDTSARKEESKSKTFKLPATSGRGRRSEPLSIIADDEGAILIGLSFSTGKPGIYYDAIGPVGADARVYLSLDRASLRDHIQNLDPDLIVIMLGGNDALKVRSGLRTLDDIERDHLKLIEVLRAAVPKADCMLWSPMDAGERSGGRIVSKSFVAEVRDAQRSAAKAKGCSFWDMFESMGGKNSFARWHELGIMNDDLVHPRAVAGELLGHLFSMSFMDSYLGEEPASRAARD